MLLFFIILIHINTYNYTEAVELTPLSVNMKADPVSYLSAHFRCVARLGSASSASLAAVSSTDGKVSSPSQLRYSTARSTSTANHTRGSAMINTFPAHRIDTSG